MKRAQLGNRGFTLLEVMMVVAVMATLAGMAVALGPGFLRHAKAEAGIAQALDVMRSAREVAISQRRNVAIQFIGNNALRTVRMDIPNGTTNLRTIQMENRMQFIRLPGVPDTPDLFGTNGTAISFGLTNAWMFTSEGTFVDANGDVLNGTLFIGIPNETNSARAISVFGATALIRSWQWNGREWVP